MFVLYGGRRARARLGAGLGSGLRARLGTGLRSGLGTGLGPGWRPGCCLAATRVLLLWGAAERPGAAPGAVTASGATL